MRVRVGWHHISGGDFDNRRNCPLWHAITDQIGEEHDVCVEMRYVCIDGMIYDLPMQAFVFMNDGIDGREVTPFEFEIKYEMETA